MQIEKWSNSRFEISFLANNFILGNYSIFDHTAVYKTISLVPFTRQFQYAHPLLVGAENFSIKFFSVNKYFKMATTCDKINPEVLKVLKIW